MKSDTTKPATRKDLERFATKDDLKKHMSALEIRTDIKMEKMEGRIDDKSKEYKNQVLTVMDHIVNKLKTMRVEQAMANENARRMLDRIEKHETRITKLETNQKRN